MSIDELWTARNASGLQLAPVSAAALPRPLNDSAFMPASCCCSAPCSGEVMTAPMKCAPSCVTALRAALTVLAGCPSVCALISSTLWPSTPPLALACWAAYSHAFSASVPNTASAPLDGGINTTFSGSWLEDPEPAAPPPLLLLEPQADRPP